MLRLKVNGEFLETTSPSYLCSSRRWVCETMFTKHCTVCVCVCVQSRNFTLCVCVFFSNLKNHLRCHVTNKTFWDYQFAECFCRVLLLWFHSVSGGLTATLWTLTLHHRHWCCFSDSSDFIFFTLFMCFQTRWHLKHGALTSQPPVFSHHMFLTTVLNHTLQYLPVYFHEGDETALHSSVQCTARRHLSALLCTCISCDNYSPKKGTSSSDSLSCCK